MMKLFDSVKKEKLDFIPKKENEVCIYLCGPTTYDDAHLGHARSSVCFDLLHRVFIALGFRVKFARNYTDIDDKILKKMKESGRNLSELTDFYIAAYERDMKALNVLDPDFKPRATHFIREMISLIAHLQKQGFAYVLEDGVYFDTSKDKSYLSLSKRGLEENITRLENEVAKKNESDFVLWKFDENFYDAPFGKGRPGWHTECVAMINSLFNEGLDIHAGGIDLLFPHHENEASQCRCANNYELASYWLHNGFVNINGEKMSKSLNNSFFIKDALNEFHPELLRFYLQSSHYRAHFNYSLEDLALSKKRLDKFYRLKQRLDLKEFSDFDKNKIYSFESEVANRALKDLSDELNISKALATLDEFIVEANLELDKEPKNISLKLDLKQGLEELALLFGFGFLAWNEYFQFGVSREQKELIMQKIQERNEAKKMKDFSTADKIRAELAQMNIVLLDTPQGTIWEKNNA